ncbi:Hypothetical predicted protein [Lecanosticta acicola]|uniref:Uncharacterized protein n=1 Tax=Lecanosticta acicola TaxID=111012 RepID=A0AAI9EA10_9PEZI|nr:Hypothetical predicted protein [Lecanosticta acicola]
MPDLADLLDQMSMADRSSQPATHRPVSPLGSSRYERPFDPREYRSSSRRPTNPPPLHRSESRRREHSHRSGPSRRTSSPGIPVDLSSLGADFDPRPRIAASRAPAGLGIDFGPSGFHPRRAREQDEFDRLHDQRRHRTPPPRDYFDGLGSGFDGRDPPPQRRSRPAQQPERYMYDMSTLSGGPPMRYGAGYGGYRSSRPSGAPPTTTATAEYLASTPSRSARPSRRDHRDYIPPSDENRYVYPLPPPSSSARPSSSSREHRSHRSGGGGLRGLFR